LNQISERLMRWVRWILAISWLLLIVSLFYDPISLILTDAENFSSPLRIHPETCILLQGECVPQQPYSLGVRLFWSVIVPAAIFIIFVFGHEAWRRICPLSFLSQLPRSLQIQRKRKTVNAGIVSYQLVAIADDSWLGQNHFYVQFGLFFLGLTARLLFVNANPVALGVFLIATISSAMLVGFLYAGKSWCNYFCPFAPVQAVFTGPRGLLGSKAHVESDSPVPQSMCRTIDNQSACVGCKASCIDIDSEQSYWDNLEKPARRFVQYGYVGILIAFFGYFYLFAGNWDYYFSGVWSREDAIGMLFKPGFYLFGTSIPLPKLVAVPLTLGLCTWLAYLALNQVEKMYRGHLQAAGVLNIRQRSHHVIFTLVTVFSFWFFFSFAGRPILNTLPNGIITAFNSIVIVVGSIWGYRTFKRTPAHYYHERDSITVSSSDLDSTAVDLEEIPSELLNQRVELKSDLANSTSTVVKRSTKNKSTTTQTRRNS
jgi:hypothetical protein